MIITLDKTPCIELSFADFDEHSTILSFELDKQLIKEALLEHDFNKVYNWNTVVDFDIEIDSVNTFDSVNLRRISYSTLQHYNGNRVYACIVPIAKRQEDEELTFYYRIQGIQRLLERHHK